MSPQQRKGDCIHSVHRITHNLNLTWFSWNIEIKQENCTGRAWLCPSARPARCSKSNTPKDAEIK
jgi:hypothetical protein